jgi:hypothetical protein
MLYIDHALMTKIHRRDAIYRVPTVMIVAATGYIREAVLLYAAPPEVKIDELL